MFISPRGQMIGAFILELEKGSNEDKAAPKPTIFPFGTLLTGTCVRGASDFGALRLTRSDHDFGRGRGGADGVTAACGGECDLGDKSAIGGAGRRAEFRGDVGAVDMGVCARLPVSLNPNDEPFDEDG